MTTGIPLFSASTRAGANAVANEVQDRCGGHPQISGQYHYHSLSPCIADTGSQRSHSKLLGWALDGFGIYGYRGPGRRGHDDGEARCLPRPHPRDHVAGQAGADVHYHATRDFPYVISCYRGKAITSATGLGVGGGGPPGGHPAAALPAVRKRSVGFRLSRPRRP